MAGRSASVDASRSVSRFNREFPATAEPAARLSNSRKIGNGFPSGIAEKQRLREGQRFEETLNRSSLLREGSRGGDGRCVPGPQPRPSTAAATEPTERRSRPSPDSDKAEPWSAIPMLDSGAKPFD